MSHEMILIEKNGHVGLVTFNRPQVLNALNHQLVVELMDALKAFDHEDSIGAIVVTGNAKAFAAGADIKEMIEQNMQQIIDRDFVGPFSRIMEIQKPIIAAVSGYALGGGCEVAMSCDMIIASETAKFGQPEVTIGVIPGAGGTQRLTRAVGKAIAMEMILNNRTLSAQEALQFGLVNRVVPVDQYLAEALKLAEEIASRAPLAVKAGKRMINKAFQHTLTDAIQAERKEFYKLFESEDQKEGMKAFVEKRKAKWSGK